MTSAGGADLQDSGKLSSLYWEDFEVGDRFVTPWGRTITDAHILAFSGVSADFQHLHVDELYAARSQFGARVAHGQLTAITAFGMQVYTQVWRHAIAYLEERHEYRSPVYVGDTIYSVMDVLEIRQTKNPDRGVVIYRNSVTDQHGDLACVSHYTMMIRRRPASNGARS